ncbi:Uncharacterised protein [Burkholderia pseudomallei]|nr:Uncharacterised protein [Burkholderia pseudomallei]
MRRARYVGVGKLSDERWGSDLGWHCDAYWPDEVAQSPTMLVVSIKASVSGAKLHDVCLSRFDGLAGSRSSFMAEDWLQGIGFNQRSAKMKITLRHDGFIGNQLVLSGTWYQRIHLRQTARDFTLQGDLIETGIGDLPSLKDASNPEAKCNVQHIAHQLEELLVKLSNAQTLTKVDAGKLQELIQDYRNRDCGSQLCRPGNCSFRQSHSWLEVLHRYKDIRDVLHYEKSGISDNPPRLRARHGVDPFGLPVRQPGHYNP